MFLEGIFTPWYVSIPNADLDPTWPGAMVGLMPIFGREGTGSGPVQSRLWGKIRIQLLRWFNVKRALRFSSLNIRLNGRRLAGWFAGWLHVCG